MLLRRRLRKVHREAQQGWSEGINAAFTGGLYRLAFSAPVEIAYKKAFETARAAKGKAEELNKPYATVPQQLPAEVWMLVLAETLRP